MAIRLDIVKPTTAVETARKAGYLYKDILFDLKASYGVRGGELLRSNSVKDLEAIYDVPVYHMSHKTNRVPQGGDLTTMHDSEKARPPRFIDDWKWVEFFTQSENNEDWGLGNTEIEYEMI